MKGRKIWAALGKYLERVHKHSCEEPREIQVRKLSEPVAGKERWFWTRLA